MKFTNSFFYSAASVAFKIYIIMQSVHCTSHVFESHLVQLRMKLLAIIYLTPPSMLSLMVVRIMVRLIDVPKIDIPLYVLSVSHSNPHKQGHTCSHVFALTLTLVSSFDTNQSQSDCNLSAT